MINNSRGSMIMAGSLVVFSVILLSLAGAHSGSQSKKGQLGRAVAKLPSQRFLRNRVTGMTEVNPEFEKTAEELAQVEGVSVEEASEELDAAREVITDVISEEIGATTVDVANHIDAAIQAIESIAKREGIDYGAAAQKVAALGEIYEAARSVVTIGEPLRFNNRAERRKYEAEQRDHAKNQDKRQKEIQKRVQSLVGKTQIVIADNVELESKEAIAKDLQKHGESKKEANADADAIINLEMVVDQNAANDKPQIDTVVELEEALDARKTLTAKESKKGVITPAKGGLRVKLDVDIIEATKTVAALQTSTIKKFAEDFDDGSIYERLKETSHTLHGLAKLTEKAKKHVPEPRKVY